MKNDVVAKEPKSEYEDKWRTEEDLRAWQRVHEVKKDKSRMADLRKLVAAREKETMAVKEALACK